MRNWVLWTTLVYVYRKFQFYFFDSFQVFLDMPQAMLEKLLNLPDDYVDPPPNASNSTLGSVVLVLASLVFVFLAVFYKNNV